MFCFYETIIEQNSHAHCTILGIEEVWNDKYSPSSRTIWMQLYDWQPCGQCTGAHAANVTNAYLAIMAVSKLSVAPQIIVPRNVSAVQAFCSFSTQQIVEHLELFVPTSPCAGVLP